VYENSTLIPPNETDRVAIVEAKYRRLRNVLIVGAVVVVSVFLIAFATARHWTKVDVPEHPETFRSEEYLTGAYEVEQDGINPCWVDQDWTDCINEMVDQYNGACANVELTVSADALCTRYGESIDEMKREDRAGWVVETLGGWGHLSRYSEMSMRQVSNDDFRPAVTHEAVCYLGFLGECEQSGGSAPWNSGETT